MDIFSELGDIGNLLRSASILEAVRREVRAVMSSEFVVTDGKHHEGASGYEVVVRCGASDEIVSRRLRSRIESIDVERVSEGVIGIRRGRRS